ncbi:MAG TPA: primosomal protein N' [Thiolapillus brandeum]|uniref:Replication restart protein PriA n=1 Tax=Thiolapillus brandeum TaxID=1076588 RepID=A0A831RWT5_9GAMM|nr:primosomal protein N' [Thiolapillus brandeum]
MTMILRIALPAPVYGLFDYLPVKNAATPALQPGQRLLVPFGRSERCGILIEVTDHTSIAQNRLRAVRAVLDEAPLMDREHLDYLRWVAGYYHHPVGEVLLSALPVRLRKGKKPLLSRPDRVRLLDDDPQTLAVLQRRAPRQWQVMNWLESLGGQASMGDLRRQFDSVHGVLRALQNKGLITLDTATSQADPPQQPDFTLEDEQNRAIAAVSAGLGRYGAFLLDGVTGSGKTEVYLRLAQQVLTRGQNVLLLVPEIALTPQLISRLEKRLPGPLAVLHSGRSDREREQAWLMASRGQARVVLGTRSAVLAPLPDLGLVLVDEEHDSSYKQQEGFRYSARDMALVRARRAGCPVVLGSATPSLESLKNAMEDRYTWLRLTRRAGKARQPRMQLLDIRNQRLQGGLSPPLLQALEETLSQGQQAMVFLNRRGYAPVLTCYSCGWLSDCPRCDARQTVHYRQRKLICHHCGNERPLPDHCPSCGSPELHPLGQGTEQLEQVLQQQYPDHPLVRIDRDATSTKGSLDQLLKQAREGRASLLVGTQMLAKGHHFPGVSLVAMVDVDGGLFGADFRAAERMAQLIIQVAGRAGRGAHPGQVLMQTRFPDHPLLQTLVNEDYAAFAREALRERAQAELPPCSYQVLIRASASKAETAETFLQQSVTLIEELGEREIQVWGPVPAPMQKRAGKFRSHLLLQSGDRQQLQRFLGAFIPALSTLPDATRVRWSVDVDPQDLY